METKVTHLHHKSLKEETVFEHRGLELLKMKCMLCVCVGGGGGGGGENRKEVSKLRVARVYDSASSTPTHTHIHTHPHLRKVRVHSHCRTPQCPSVTHQTSRLTQLPSQGTQPLLKNWRTEIIRVSLLQQSSLVLPTEYSAPAPCVLAVEKKN